MTPIVSISGGDLPGGSLLGVDLQPSGLRLYEFAELSIVPPELSPTASIAGFSYEGDGDDLHRYPAALEPTSAWSSVRPRSIRRRSPSRSRSSRK